jgi:hypothetical protein
MAPDTRRSRPLWSNITSRDAAASGPGAEATAQFTFTGTTAKNVIVSGRYSIADGRITFREMSAACSSMKASGCMPVMGCRGAGIYDFNRDGPTLSFVRVRDTRCRYRPIVLSGRFRRTR